MKKTKTIQSKFKSPVLFAVCLAAVFGLASCGDKEHAHDDDEHEGHDHDKKEESAKHDKHEGHDHGKDEDGDGHAHDVQVAGPNGGRVITSVEPHAEFFVTDDRKVQISFVDDDLIPVDLGDQKVTVVAGERSDPTNLKFAKSGNFLVSDVALPDGNDFPVILNIKPGAGAESVREKFNLNLSDCPTCDYKEYACTCDHDDE